MRDCMRSQKFLGSMRRQKQIYKAIIRRGKLYTHVTASASLSHGTIMTLAPKKL